MAKCKSCDFENPDDTKFCGGCGVPADEKKAAALRKVIRREMDARDAEKAAERSAKKNSDDFLSDILGD